MFVLPPNGGNDSQPLIRKSYLEYKKKTAWNLHSFTVFAMENMFHSQGHDWSQVLEVLVIDSKEVFGFSTDFFMAWQLIQKHPMKKFGLFPGTSSYCSA